MVLAEDDGQAGDSRVGCRCRSDTGGDFSAYSANCGALRWLQMALVKTSDTLAHSAYRVAAVDDLS